MTSTRHSWGEPARFDHKSERECRRCGMVKVTRHESEGPHDVHWTEFWRDCEQIATQPTPPCDARLEVRA
jgi:hypothetical protein